MTYNEFEGENLRDGTNLSTGTKHPVPNAVYPRRFHCSHNYLLQVIKVADVLTFIIILRAECFIKKAGSNAINARYGHISCFTSYHFQNVVGRYLLFTI